MANTQCNQTDTICPDNCEDQQLPTVNFDDCSPELNESEIEWIAVSRSDAEDFTDVEDVDEWTARINQAAATPAPSPDNSIRMLRVIGDKPAPEITNRTVSGGRIVQTAKNHTLNIEVDETNSLNYEFARSTGCNATYKLWYITKAGLVYGGTCGLSAQLILNLVQARGDGEIELYQGTVTWQDKI